MICYKVSVRTSNIVENSAQLLFGLNFWTKIPISYAGWSADSNYEHAVLQ